MLALLPDSVSILFLILTLRAEIGGGMSPIAPKFSEPPGDTSLSGPGDVADPQV